jgi:hypothetical protein
MAVERFLSCFIHYFCHFFVKFFLSEGIFCHSLPFILAQGFVGIVGITVPSKSVELFRPEGLVLGKPCIKFCLTPSITARSSKKIVKLDFGCYFLDSEYDLKDIIFGV